jgi:hypothetical protein
MKEKNKKHSPDKTAKHKDMLSQKDLIAGTSSFALPVEPHAALETPDGKNNGAEPAAFRNEPKSQT